jgi:CheY-like chemotaxis protein
MTRHIHLVRSNTGYDDDSDLDLQEPAHRRPRVLIVTSSPDRFSDLPAIIDFAPDYLEAIATAITNRDRLDYIVADFLASNGRESGCKLVRKLRAQYRIKIPIYLVSDDPLPSDRQYAQGHGATDLLLRNRQVLSAILRGEPVRASARSARPEPKWLHDVIGAMRAFLGSEADPRVRAIYTGLQARLVDEPVQFEDVANEASLLLEDDLDDRRAFLRLVGMRK